MADRRMKRFLLPLLRNPHNSHKLASGAAHQHHQLRFGIFFLLLLLFFDPSLLFLPSGSLSGVVDACGLPTLSIGGGGCGCCGGRKRRKRETQLVEPALKDGESMACPQGQWRAIIEKHAIIRSGGDGGATTLNDAVSTQHAILSEMLARWHHEGEEDVYGGGAGTKLFVTCSSNSNTSDGGGGIISGGIEQSHSSSVAITEQHHQHSSPSTSSSLPPHTTFLTNGEAYCSHNVGGLMSCTVIAMRQ